TGPRIKEALDRVLRVAVKRGILVDSEDGLTISTQNIADYDADFLSEQFLESMTDPRAWTDLDARVRTFARWLGFRRTGTNIESAVRSVSAALVAEGRLESNGSQIRRRG